MKYLYLLVMLLLLTMETLSQTSSDSSGLSVIQKKWDIKSNSSINTDPFQAINEMNQTMKDQKDNLRENAARRQKGQPPLPQPRARTSASGVYKPNKTIPFIYIYQIKVQNSGTKTIKKVIWDYVFFDSTTNKEVGKHHFISKTNLKPRAIGNLITKLPSAPSGVINTKDARKELSRLYNEQINIKSIQYADGSIWRADSK